jgi:hypothetical protein
VRLRYGTGTAPVQGAAATGNTVDAQQYIGTIGVRPIVNAILSGLTPSTPYWFDWELFGAAAGGAELYQASITLCEQ